MSYQLALEKAGADVLVFEYFGSYQGDWLAKVNYDGQLGWVHGYYGSCSGCDSFQAEFDYDDDPAQEYTLKDGVYQHSWKDEQLTVSEYEAAVGHYNARLAQFGRNYLGELYTQQEIEAKYAKQDDWEEYDQMLAFVQKNA